MARSSNLSEKNKHQQAPVVRQEVWVPAVHAMNHRRSWPSKGGFVLAAVFALLFSVAALVGLVAVTLLFFYSDVVFPGARVATIPVGTLTSRQAAALLAEQMPRQEVLLVHSTGAWPANAADLGLSLDVENTVSRAYELGRTFSGLSNLVSGNFQVEPVWQIDEQVAKALLTRLRGAVGVEPVNAQVVVEDGEVRQIPAEEGLELDIEMTLNYLRENPTEIVRTGRLPLATRPVVAPIANADLFVSEAQRYLAKQVIIRAHDPIQNETAEWQMRPQDWQEWLSLIVAPGDPEPYSWIVDEEKAQHSLASGWSWLGDQRFLNAGDLIPEMIDVITTGRTGLDARAYYQPLQHTVRPGESYSSIGYNYGIPYPWIQQANPGISTLSVGDVVTVPSPDDMLPLPIVPGKRIVVSLSQQRARVYENGELLWDWPASTGIGSSPTSPGVFQIQSHEVEAYASNWDLYMPNFMGIYRPVPDSDFLNGFHGFPTRDGFNLLWTGDLGHPVTYGCILLSSDNAQTLYGWAEDGVIVEIQR
jgi:lipoprotein-anchoring transpeptidase ErfK/SrfK